jgi:methylenetetrahydrofolate reductase (NADPH)
MGWWPFGGREKVELSAEERTALTALVSRPEYEIIPLKDVQEKALDLPAGACVTVTASPAKGIDATAALCEWLAARGHDVVPHFSARLIRDRAHLKELIARVGSAGVRRLFVVGGDGETVGEFGDGLALLRGIHEVGHPFTEITVPAYPEGHASIADDVLLRVLKEKQPLANGMRTQMAFNPEAVAIWLEKVRGEGITLPLLLGVPGVVEMTKLLRIATQIGVADSARYLTKNTSMIGHLAQHGSFGPDAFLDALSHTLTQPAANAHALHLFTFNQIAATAAWQKRMLEKLAS